MAEVVVGKDGWLFLAGGSNEVLRFYTEPAFFSDETANLWIKLLGDRHRRLAQRSINYLHLTVPDKLSVFPQYFPSALDCFARHPIALINALAERQTLTHVLVDPTRALSMDHGPLPTYFRTDSHWTVWGAYLAYQLICERLGLAASALAPFEGRASGVSSDVFDLGSKLSPPVSESKTFIPMRNAVVRCYSNSVVDALENYQAHESLPPPHHGAHVIFMNTSATCVNKKIVIFGDSFADYRPSSLTAFLAETFLETHFIWSTSVDHRYVAMIGADIVLTEIAERFMNIVPDDDFSVPP